MARFPLLFDTEAQYAAWAELSEQMRRELTIFADKSGPLFRSSDDGSIIRTWTALADRKLINLYTEYSGRLSAVACINVSGRGVLRAVALKGQTAGGNVIPLSAIRDGG